MPMSRSVYACDGGAGACLFQMIAILMPITGVPSTVQSTYVNLFNPKNNTCKKEILHHPHFTEVQPKALRS